MEVKRAESKDVDPLAVSLADEWLKTHKCVTAVHLVAEGLRVKEEKLAKLGQLSDPCYRHERMGIRLAIEWLDRYAVELTKEARAITAKGVTFYGEEWYQVVYGRI